MRRFIVTAVLAFVILAMLAPPGFAQAPAPKYIFLFLADGAGIPHMEITRQYNRVVHNEGLVISAIS